MLLHDADAVLEDYRAVLNQHRAHIPEIARIAGVSRHHLTKIAAGRVDGRPANPAVRTLTAITQGLVAIGAVEAPESAT